MNTRFISGFLAAFFASGVFSTAHSMIERLDDNASSMRFVSPQRVIHSGFNAFADAIEATLPTHTTLHFGRVNYRLATAKYVGKKARIFFVIPHADRMVSAPSALRVEWRGGRTFANGSAFSGERIPVWQGVVTNSVLSEDIELTMQLDLHRLQPGSARMSANIESYFEIEVLP
ncbi:MAG: hypothetical protein ACRDAM_11140 [Casimicrobium sp.]